MLSLKINHILVDIDGTITSLKDNPYLKIPGIGLDYFRGILRDILKIVPEILEVKRET